MNKEIGKILKKSKGGQAVMNKEDEFENALNNLKVEIERVNDSKDKIRKRIEELKDQRRMINSSNGITLVGFDIEKIENDNQVCNLTDINSKIENFEFALKQNIFNDEKLRIAAAESDLRTVSNQLIGNIYFNKKIILKNIKNHLFVV